MPSLNPKKSEADMRAETKAALAKTLGTNMMMMLGDSGTERYSGYIMEEYKQEWRDEARVRVVEEMRRGDGSARAGLRAIKTPLLATTWSITTKDDSPKGEEIRAFIEQNLFGMRTRTWKEFLKEALAFLDFGHYCFEIIWEKGADGKIHLKDLAPRIPSSILRWKLTDGRFGIVQQIRTDDNVEGLKAGMAEIPASKLLILTNEKEGDDVTGQSVMRAAWKHWSLKQMLYKIQGIAAERFGVGIPIITMDGSGGDEARTEAEDWGKALKSNNKGFLVLPSKEWSASILTPTGNPQSEAIISAIDHHDRAMLHAMLASFIMLGSGSSSGSYNLGENLLYFFFKSCEDSAEYLSSQILNQVIKQIVDVNYGVQEIYPKLAFAHLGDMDTVETSAVLKTLSDAGLLLKDSRMLEYVHKSFKLPDIPQETLDALKDAEIAEDVADLEEEEEPKEEKEPSE